MALSPQAHALDLQSEAGSLEAMVKLRCSLDPQQEEILWWAGTLFAQEPGKKAAPLMGFEGYNICRAEKQSDGVWRLYTRELTFYRDLKTGKIIDSWDNPLSGERNEVVQVANDPVNTVLNAPGRPLHLPWVEAGDEVMLTLNIPLAYPNPLQPAEFPAESSGPTYMGSEHFMFFAPRAAMEDPALKSVPVTYGWTRVGPWLPWMKLGSRPGSLLYIAQGNKRASVDELPADIQELVRSKYPEYARAPETWVQPNMTSWSYYKQLQQQRAAEKQD
ncbi:DUF1838 family protein [Stenotrophomonas sp. JC08]|uniref:DUF1838 family protein n=1 Tax=Stenotrophomonas sp. JC08 TaxID=3445779 RepID=UPI003FA2B06A